MNETKTRTTHLTLFSTDVIFGPILARIMRCDLCGQRLTNVYCHNSAGQIVCARCLAKEQEEKTS